MPATRSILSYVETYRDPTPMRPIDQGNLIEHPNCGAPHLTRAAGRPKKQRIRAEGNRQRVQEQHCTDCRQTGHNSRSCRNPPLLDQQVVLDFEEWGGFGE